MKLHTFATLPLAVLLSGGVAMAQEGSVSAPSVATSAEDRRANVSLAPLRIEMDGEQRAETLRVFNPSGRAIGVQVRAFGWKQENGEDAFFPSNAVTVSPSIITIAAGETQIFRVVRRDLAAQGERRFRVAIDQLPDPELMRAGEAQARIRFTIPMFFDRASAAPVKMGWTFGPDGLRAENSGEQTARMVNVSVTTAGGQPVPVDITGLHYIHGGSALQWPLEGPCTSGPITVTALIDGEEVNAQATNTCS
ncbi:fimbrial biogenesis chaperone [Pontixanthobacter sp.]|uniref:fimbrial biogenesis chaperone n=1 Tax=Pontixanthobacter sp. TaxID=2792078 RepID=UPI003C7AD8A3